MTKPIDTALAIRRGEKKMKDVPAAEQSAVRNEMRSNRNLRAHALAQQPASLRHVGQQTKMRRAHSGA